VDSPTPVIIALPLPFWNDWNVLLPILPNTSRYRPERSVERSRVEYRQACLGETIPRSKVEFRLEDPRSMKTRDLLLLKWLKC
jgi:hypothetical protein